MVNNTGYLLLILAGKNTVLKHQKCFISSSNFEFLVLLIADQTMASDQLKLIQDLLDSYDSKAKPTWDNNRPVNVTFSMDLYQLLELVSCFIDWKILICSLFFRYFETKNVPCFCRHKTTFLCVGQKMTTPKRTSSRLFKVHGVSEFYATKV